MTNNQENCYIDINTLYNKKNQVEDFGLHNDCDNFDDKLNISNKYSQIINKLRNNVNTKKEDILKLYDELLFMPECVKDIIKNK